ncbi:MAG: DNA translocase FtsK [Candidatus Omnitrophica bacterium]|nr:DNA translocase FtsK [Candidatus Omnitrophota bacterium]MBU1925327.1 DNA translocase FtsK [Candidatus Omnitrophota bacterium]
MSEKQIRVLWSVVFFGICVFLVVSFVSYDANDIRFNTSSPNFHIKNFGGYVGAYLVWSLFFSVGFSAYFIPLLFSFWAVSKIIGKTPQNLYVKILGFILVIFSFSALMSTLNAAYNVSRVKTGGVVGFYISLFLTRYFGQIGTIVILGTIFLLALLLASEFLILPIVMVAAQSAMNLLKLGGKGKEASLIKLQRVAEKKVVKDNSREKTEKDILADKRQVKDSRSQKEVEFQEIEKSKLIIKKAKPPRPQPKQTRPIAPKFVGDYKLPSLDLLITPPPIEERIIKDDLEGNSKVLEETLRDFGIEVKVVEVEQGPVITRYELQPAPGVKITQIMNLSDDIALNLKAPSVHIVAPIPGKGTVGIDVPNTKAALVYLKEVIESAEFQNSESKLTLALGKDISGVPLVTDLADMPHFLIAGTTGSGKTVCVNSLIMSLLFQASPEEVKLILVDPKMVEMSMYNGLPHLICPVVTDVKKAAAALDWAVSEMEERYKLLAKVGARNIIAFNRKVKEGLLKDIDDGDKKVSLEPMPYIVIIIDELADMMLLAAKEVEGSITRLAQLSRAVGIHLILATQRPSVDVVTGVIKANFPARVSFRVASKVDSRTVLDMNGADKLLGRGDMLFLKPGNFKLIRSQSSLVCDKEIEAVVAFAKEQRSAVYTEEILKEQEKIFSYKDRAKDELFEEAAKLVINTKQASVSMLQRRLRLGYARAARLIDMMEEEGIVGSFRGSKPREILVDSWEDITAAKGHDAEDTSGEELE